MLCTSPNSIIDGKWKKGFHDHQIGKPNQFMIGCGQCFNCKLNKSRTWSIRCSMEAKDWKYNYFITLTYDDDHLVINDDVLYDETGEYSKGATLVKKHIQLFNWKLRRKLKYHKLGFYKYLVAGEYGDKTLRPHYHMIMFSNWSIPDLKYYKKNSNGDSLYTSEFMSNLWGHGYVVVGDFSPQTASYVANYTLKKKYGAKNKLFYKNKEPEFMICSQSIGFNQFKKHYDDYVKSNQIIAVYDYKLIKSSVPLYWYQKTMDDYQLDKVKAKRVKDAKRQFKNYLRNNDSRSLNDLLQKQHFINIIKQKKFKKKEI